MMLPDGINLLLKALLEDRAGSSAPDHRPGSQGQVTRPDDPVKITGSRPVGGGCINECFRVETSVGTFFVKLNDANRYPGMFESEARGLELLRRTVSGGVSGGALLLVPEVIGHASDGRYSLLVLEFLEGGGKAVGFWADFGAGLARLHAKGAGQSGGQNREPFFGLDHNNYIGSLPQSNRPHGNWPEFFVEERLEPQLKLARDSGRTGGELVRDFGGLFPRLPEFFPEEPPALLHGDLWSGNFMVAKGGKAAIVDPAVYYGHRYVDLGMSLLFGGFAPDFYAAYNAAFQMDKGWREGAEVANLYPLMVHLNLFGEGYLGNIRSVLKKFR